MKEFITRLVCLALTAYLIITSMDDSDARILTIAKYRALSTLGYYPTFHHCPAKDTVQLICTIATTEDNQTYFGFGVMNVANYTQTFLVVSLSNSTACNQALSRLELTESTVSFIFLHGCDAPFDVYFLAEDNTVCDTVEQLTDRDPKTVEIWFSREEERRLMTVACVVACFALFYF